VLEHAVPVLREHGFPATLFVPTKWIGGANAWDPRGEALELMSGDELAELARTGFAIESHGHAHADYARMDAAAVVQDVRTSVERLSELLGRPPRYLAYPYGRASAAAAEEAARLGLRAAFGLDHSQPLSGDFAVRRVSIVPADTTPLFALKTAGRYIGWRQSRPVRAVYGAVRPLVRNRWLWP
jgi:peptidoglycan/xylan/chitin deacetylase (PgdA/CDA1 family)